jgi:hypothetical protein
MALDIPLPKVVSDVGPGGGFFTNYNAITNASLENRKKELENKFAPALNLANIAHLVSPVSLYGHDAGPLAYLNAMKNGQNPSAPQQDSLNALMQLFNGGQQGQSPAQNPMAQQSQQGSQSQNAMMQPTQGADQYTGNGGGRNALNENSDAAKLPNNPSAIEIGGQPGSTVTPLQSPQASNAAQSAESGGTDDLYKSAVAGLFPLSDAAIDLKAKKARKLAASSADVGLWTDKIKSTTENLNNSNSMITSLDAMDTLYNKLHPYEKGPYAGQVKALSNDAQSFDKLHTHLSSASSKALTSGRITDKDFAIGDSLVPSRTLGDQAYKQASDYNKSLALRPRQEQQFISDALEKGMPYAQSQKMWANFIKTNPLFDSKTLKLIPENAEISPFDAQRNTKQSKTKNGQGASNIMTAPEGSIVMTAPDGSMHTVHNSQVEKAKRESGFRVGG